MLCIKSGSTDPYFNLAAEEFLLRSVREDAFLLYRNRPTVVIGKHQNTLAEIEPDFIRRKGILVARRISGGGSVYHDLGNLNFTFVTNGKEGELVNYRKHTFPVVAVLKELGLNAHLGKRNELLLGKEKISGTASHVFRERVLHHGTLLFSTSMDDLKASLRTGVSHYSDRSVKSVSSGVTNIRDHLADKISAFQFLNRMFDFMLHHLVSAQFHRFTPSEREKIRSLRDRKFATWEWIYGYSPRYEFSRELWFRGRKITLHLKVEKGIIREIAFEGAPPSHKDKGGLVEILTGSCHDPEMLERALSSIRVTDYIPGLENKELISAMF